MSGNKHGSKWIWPATRKRIYARDGHACVHCGEREDLTLDHITPRSRGGSNKPTNLVTACRRCNTARGPSEYPPADKARLKLLAMEKLPCSTQA